MYTYIHTCFKGRISATASIGGALTGGEKQRRSDRDLKRLTLGGITCLMLLV